jgi:hypothetical protein
MDEGSSAVHTADPVVPYSINLRIDNTAPPPNPEIQGETFAVIQGVRDTTCDLITVPVAESEPLLFDDDSVPSSTPSETGKYISAFGVTGNIKDIIAPYNREGGAFDRIKLMIHSLFHGNAESNIAQKHGFVGFTPAGFLSEYTATIYYAANDSCIHYRNIIKIMLHNIERFFLPGDMSTRDMSNSITYAFKLDKGIKFGDTIKLILSLTFGDGPEANVILVPILNIVGFNLCYDGGVVGESKHIDFFMRLYHIHRVFVQGDSIFDLIARIRLYANQEAFGALIEPTDAEKDLVVNLFSGKDIDHLRWFILFIKFAFYTNARGTDKNFAFFLNIFFNFFKVSMNHPNPMASRSTAKIMYTDFFSTHNNYGSIIRIFNTMMGFPLFKQHAIMFLSGSNAARAYKLVQEILPPPAGAAPAARAAPGDIYDTHMATLSDNDFMFYLLNENSEPYRLAIRMMLGACLYYLKNILDTTERETFTNLLEESISIVGHNDHLLAQRLNANQVFLKRCFDSPLLLGTKISEFLISCNLNDVDFYQELSGNVTLAFLDVVFKHNTAEYWYDSVFSIFDIDIPHRSRSEVLHFLTTDAMAVNCIATPWTLILNILYTIFVTENCVARIVVGKLGNDPKNLEKYFSILDTHLRYLKEYYTTSIRETEERETKDRNEDRETEISRDRERDREKSTGRGRGRGRSRSRIRDSKKQMLDEIIKTLSLQQDISKKSKIFQTNQTTENYDELKTSCGLWVQKMVTLACDTYTRELFFLSVEYQFITRARAPTPLETGISCAWSKEGNICNKGEFLAKYAPADFDDNTTQTTASEQKMHAIVPQLQNLINTAVITAQKFDVSPNPPVGVLVRVWTHYEYMNHLWKHLTETSINLRSNFKSIVKDLTQIVGSKYFTAISLLGAYPCGLLIDELEEKENTNLLPQQLTELKNSEDILKCRQGLLPLLVPEDVPNDLTRSTLFATMVVELLYLEFYPFSFAPAPPPRAAADDIYSTNNILIFLGFLFSIKIKSNASVGPRNMLSLVDSITNFHNIPDPGLLHVASGGMAKKKSETAKASKASKTSAEPVPTSAGPVTPWVLSAAPVPPSLEQESLHALQNPWSLPSAPSAPIMAPTASAKASVKPPAAPKKESVKASAARGIQKKSITDEEIIKIEPDIFRVPKPKANLKANPKAKTSEEMKDTPPTIKPLPKKSTKLQTAEVTIRRKKTNYELQLLNPSTGSFKNFMDKLRIVALTKGINFVPKTKVTGVGNVEEVREKTYRIARKYNNMLDSNATLNPYYEMYTHLGGGSNRNNNKTKSMNKLSKKNNHTRRNNNKRKNKLFPNHRKVIPYSRSGSQSNRKKSKAKLSRKNVTFKRRRSRK